MMGQWVNGQMDKCSWRVVGNSQLWDKHYTPSVPHVTTAGRDSLQTHSQSKIHLMCQTQPDHCTSNKGQKSGPQTHLPCKEARLNSAAFPVPPTPKLSDLGKVSKLFKICLARLLALALAADLSPPPSSLLLGHPCSPQIALFPLASWFPSLCFCGMLGLPLPSLVSSYYIVL